MMEAQTVRQTRDSIMPCLFAYNVSLRSAWEQFDKTDVTPAILSRDFVAQLYRATKLQNATVHVAH